MAKSFEEAVTPEIERRRKVSNKNAVKAHVPVPVLGSLLDAAKKHLAAIVEVNGPDGIKDCKLAVDIKMAERIYKKMNARNERAFKFWKERRERDMAIDRAKAEAEDVNVEALTGMDSAAPLATVGDALDRPTRW